ncbi:DNA translocase FtsK [Bacillus sp. RG28]|uniref:DNA translocase FtsK n=1 Tax=Gottfriedia endophytica TaxID=2820819 RepID=A0A940NSK6_9BACI|nr:FtsK/SpoIIIE domain-containing protein [Gottfriedia endophytica]MBP0726773.1 DNA translocase FtsK [Gottfriedia endophytica]
MKDCLMDLYSRYREWILKNEFENEIKRCFRLGEISHKYGETIVYPTIVRIGLSVNCLEAVLNLPRGFNPEDVAKKSWVFNQSFGENVELKRVSAKTFILYVMSINPFKETIIYNYENIYSEIMKYDLPIYVGITARGGSFSYDMVEQPHLLIAGETGSGKSVLLRTIVTTLLLSKSVNELQMYMFDMKKSEFFLYKRIPQVKIVTHEKSKIKSCFNELKKEMGLRGDLLEQYEVSHVNELPKEIRPPFITIFIDEFSLIDDKLIYDLLQQIAAIGRALGVFVILSTQRPSAKILEGELKVHLTVRIGGRVQDGTNSRIIIDTEGCETLTTSGHMKAKTTKGIIDVKVPLLKVEHAKSILEPYKLPNEEIAEKKVEFEIPLKSAKKVSTNKIKKSKVIVWSDFK